MNNNNIAYEQTSIIDYITLDFKDSVIIGENTANLIKLSPNFNENFNILIGNNVSSESTFISKNILIGYDNSKYLKNSTSNIILGNNYDYNLENINNNVIIGNNNTIDNNLYYNTILGNNNIINANYSIILGNDNDIQNNNKNNILIGNNLKNTNFNLNIDNIILNDDNNIYIGYDSNLKVFIGFDNLTDINNLLSKNSDLLHNLYIKDGVITNYISVNNNDNKITIECPDNLTENISYILPNPNDLDLADKKYFLSFTKENNKYKLNWNENSSADNLNLDDIQNGTINKFISNNTFNNDLIINGILTVKKINIIGESSYVTREELSDLKLLQGPQGLRGFKGDIGPQGPQGIPGINGINGKGFNGGVYNQNTGVVSFLSEDGIGFNTTDIRGKSGNGWTSITYEKRTGQLTFKGTVENLTYTSDDIRGPKGDKGDKGDKGEKGDQGIQGETGPAGTTDYDKLLNTPTLSSVAISGNYNDLTNIPFTPSYLKVNLLNTSSLSTNYEGDQGNFFNTDVVPLNVGGYIVQNNSIKIPANGVYEVSYNMLVQSQPDGSDRKVQIVYIRVNNNNPNGVKQAISSTYLRFRKDSETPNSGAHGGSTILNLNQNDLISMWSYREGGDGIVQIKLGHLTIKRIA
jgi:hypothetical protein